MTESACLFHVTDKIIFEKFQLTFPLHLAILILVKALQVLTEFITESKTLGAQKMLHLPDISTLRDDFSSTLIT